MTDTIVYFVSYFYFCSGSLYSVFFYVIGAPNGIIVCFVTDKKCRKVDLLLSTPEGITPLHDAVSCSKLDVCRLLLKYGGMCRQFTFSFSYLRIYMCGFLFVC